MTAQAVEIGGEHFADPARRWAVLLDTGNLSSLTPTTWSPVIHGSLGWVVSRCPPGWGGPHMVVAIGAGVDAILSSTWMLCTMSRFSRAAMGRTIDAIKPTRPGGS